MTDSDVALDALLRALSDSTRRRLYGLVRSEPGLSTADLAARTPGMTRWGVMKHLTVLREARLIQTLPEGRRRLHYGEPAALDSLRRWLAAEEGQAVR
jgi:DNA-binding transcriptional ArsR family regulator